MIDGRLVFQIQNRHVPWIIVVVAASVDLSLHIGRFLHDIGALLQDGLEARRRFSKFFLELSYQIARFLPDLTVLAELALLAGNHGPRVVEATIEGFHVGLDAHHKRIDVLRVVDKERFLADELGQFGQHGRGPRNVFGNAGRGFVELSQFVVAIGGIAAIVGASCRLTFGLRWSSGKGLSQGHELARSVVHRVGVGFGLILVLILVCLVGYVGCFFFLCSASFLFLFR